MLKANYADLGSGSTCGSCLERKPFVLVTEGLQPRPQRFLERLFAQVIRALEQHGEGAQVFRGGVEWRPERRQPLVYGKIIPA